MINSGSSSVMHVARIGTDLIYATSYDKPQEYVDELLAEVGRLVMREVSARACEGGATPRYALDVARERSHSAKHPLMVRGYLASSKVEQSGGRTQLTCRNRSARDSRLTTSGALPSGQRLLFYRPDGRCRTLGHQQQQQPCSSAFSEPQVTRSAWESCSAAHTDNLHHSRDGAYTEGSNKPNKATLLRSMSSESSIWDAQIERLPKSQRVSARCKQQAKASDLKLKLMNRDFARSAETLHGFLVGAQYNRSRGVVEAVASGLPSDNVEYEQVIKTSVIAPATSADNGSEANKRKARPFSAMIESNAWSQQHGDNPPLYARPYSSIAGCPRRPVVERPLSALQKAITIRQLPSSSLRSCTPQNTSKSKAQLAATGIPKNGLPESTQQSFESSSPIKVTGLGSLQIVPQRVSHTRASLNVEQHHGGTRSGNAVVGTLLRANQMAREPPVLPERPSTGLQSEDVNEICIDGQGLNRQNVDSQLSAFGSNLSGAFEFESAIGVSHGDAVARGELREPAGSLALEGTATIEAPVSRSRPIIDDLLSQKDAVPEVGDIAGDTPTGGSRLSIHVDVAMLDDNDDERSRIASENDDAVIYTDIAVDQ